ncbi:MAG: hypothetical protein OXH76_16955 [Boseongicola sp.]|nr:hypothetical protein [Boseongicola sp.]MDE0697514.1 hypothetical protein [Boseongicola sp.]
MKPQLLVLNLESAGLVPSGLERWRLAKFRQLECMGTDFRTGSIRLLEWGPFM